MNSNLIIILNDINFRKDWDVIWFNEFINMLYKNIDLKYENITDILDENYFLTKYNILPSYIISYENLNFPNVKCKKILITEDLHHIELDVYKNSFKNIDYILSRFNIINNLFPDLFNDKIIYFPLYCSNIFLSNNINFESENKITLYGNITLLPQYIQRKTWHDFFCNNYNQIYNYINDSSHNTSLTLGKYSFGFCCGYVPELFRNNSNNCYLVAKFFEIPGKGLLLLADINGLEKEMEDAGFINMINYISVTFENIDNIIKFLLNPENKNLINEIRINGYNLIKNNHLISNRIDTITKLIK